MISWWRWRQTRPMKRPVSSTKGRPQNRWDQWTQASRASTANLYCCAPVSDEKDPDKLGSSGWLTGFRIHECDSWCFRLMACRDKSRTTDSVVDKNKAIPDLNGLLTKNFPFSHFSQFRLITVCVQACEIQNPYYRRKKCLNGVKSALLEASMLVKNMMKCPSGCPSSGENMMQRCLTC